MDKYICAHTGTSFDGTTQRNINIWEYGMFESQCYSYRVSCPFLKS